MEVLGMRRLLVYIFVLSLFGISSATAQDSDSRENELRTYVIKHLEKYNNEDFDNIDWGNNCGFGYRTKFIRMPRDIPWEVTLQRVKGFLKTMKYHNRKLEYFHVAVDGDIGLVWGFIVEDFQIIDKPPEKYRIRFSKTFRRTEDGHWMKLMEHRDIQNFDETGQYIPNYLKSDDSKP